MRLELLAKAMISALETLSHIQKRVLELYTADNPLYKGFPFPSPFWTGSTTGSNVKDEKSLSADSDVIAATQEDDLIDIEIRAYVSNR